MYNESEKIKYGDDFRRIQEESRRISNQEQQLFHKGSKEINETLRTRLSRILKRELATRSAINSNGYALSVIEGKGNSFEIYSNVEPQVFHDIFEINKTYLKFGELVDLHNVESSTDEVGYNDCQNYLSTDGLCGFSIAPDGNLISVFNANLNKKGWLDAIKDIVNKNCKTLDCYNSDKQPLAVMYAEKFGFKPLL